MKDLLETVIEVAKSKGKKDPDRKAKEMFVRLFKNDEFRSEFIKWQKSLREIKETIKGEDELYKMLNEPWKYEMFLGGSLKVGKIIYSIPLLPIPPGFPYSPYEFLKPAIYAFAFFGKVKLWPVFGCKLVFIYGDSHIEPSIQFEPGVSQEDVSNFIKKNWHIIQAMIATYPNERRIKRVKSHSKQELKNLIYNLDQSGLSDYQILRTLWDSGHFTKSENPLIYIRQIIQRERKLHKEDK